MQNKIVIGFNIQIMFLIFVAKMNGLEFRHRGREMVDYLVDYLDNIDA